MAMTGSEMRGRHRAAWLDRESGSQRRSARL